VHGADQLLLASGVPDGTARGPQPGRECGLADEAVTPHRVEQLVLRHHPIPVLTRWQSRQRARGLDMDRLAAPAELVMNGVQLEVLEAISVALHH
jgi:hypothetical protein